MNRNSMTELQQMITSEYDNIAGMVIRKDGKTVYEGYFHGFTPDCAFHIYSVTKSIFSSLIGIALEEGKIKSIKQKVLEFFPEYKKDPENKTIEDITIEHLLTMTAPYRLEQEPYEEFFSSDNWVNFALDFLGGDGPIGEFRYSPIIGAHILSAILVRATGQSVLEYATEHLFSPLGIVVKNVTLANKEEHMAWNMQTKKERSWVVDAQGINTASWGLALTPSDLARIGELYRNGGVWEGKQLIPEQWIETCTKEHSRWGSMPFGYLWWIIDEKEPSYAGIGDGGNVLYINKEKNLVIAIASLFQPEVKDRIELIKGRIEPMLEAIPLY